MKTIYVYTHHHVGMYIEQAAATTRVQTGRNAVLKCDGKVPLQVTHWGRGNNGRLFANNTFESIFLRLRLKFHWCFFPKKQKSIGQYVKLYAKKVPSSL